MIVDPQPGPTVQLLHLHSEPRLFVGVGIPLGDAYRPELLKAEALHQFTHLRFPPYTKPNDGEVFVYPLYPIGDARSELEMSGWSVVSEDHSVDVMEENWLVHGRVFLNCADVVVPQPLQSIPQLPQHPSTL